VGWVNLVWIAMSISFGVRYSPQLCILRFELCLQLAY
jgi:hypothetical protein